MEWFDKNATALIAAASAFISAVVAASVALLSTKFNNSQNLDRTKLQFEHENNNKKRELHINKGEEFVTCLDGWIYNCYQTQLYYTFDMIEALKPKDITSDVQKFNDTRLFPRMKMLSSVYYPNVGQMLDDMNDLHNKCTMYYAQFIGTAADKSELLIKLNQNMLEFGQLGRVVKDAVIEDIKKHI
ncbi:hypothetical protein C7420_101841 [Pantoea ananatis]|uniref:hypothetical protein n=1 Tax=Pantoea ananas TaxID=553 RepID=UPI000DC4EAE3|nr:hypothetical protein [Pantoea ananatis]RAR75224.1 hypothetical protein C7420_101841 [Pantoea ananatis]